MRWISLCALIFGCDRAFYGPPHLPALSPYPNCPTCQHAQLVISGMTIPQSNSQAQALGCDINGNGEIDNQLGKVLGAFKAASIHIDVQAAMDAAFQRGSVFMLYDIEFDPIVGMTQAAGLRAFTGMHDAGDGLTAPAFYMGQGHFTVGSEYGSGMGGTIQGGRVAVGPNDAFLQLTLDPNDPIMTLPIQRAYVTGAIDATTLTGGKLCGAIPAPLVRSMLFPHIADVFSAAIKRDPTNDFIKVLDTDRSCDTDPACTPSSSEVCHCVTAMDLDHNSVIQSLLSPDLDLDANATNPFVTDPTDPTYHNDALSFGFGLVGAKATFPLP